MSDLCERDIKASDISLNLTVTDESFEFATTIVGAMEQANMEIADLNETIESLKDLMWTRLQMLFELY